MSILFRHCRPALAVCLSLAIGGGAVAQNIDTNVNTALNEKVNFATLDQPNPYQQFIVKLKQPDGADFSRAEAEPRLLQAASITGLSVRYVRLLATGAHLISVEGELDRKDSEALMSTLAKDPQVIYVEPDTILTAQFVPNDPRYAEQWHYSEALAGINVPAAWNYGNGSGVRIAVLDTGITDHPDINANIIGGHDFISDPYSAGDGDGRDTDPTDEGNWRDTVSTPCGIRPTRDSSWHGTHVAGTVAAQTNNSEGASGIAFGAKVVPIRVLGKCDAASSDVTDAIIWAIGGSVSGAPSNPYPADIINLSLGGNGACTNSLRDAIEAALLNDVLVVTAAGNDENDLGNVFPANCFGVLNVAALDREGNLANYSNFGEDVTVSAPGGETGVNDFDGVLSLGNTGLTTAGDATYTFLQGTSMAAPHVSGVAALLLSADNTLSANDLKNIITSTARTLPGTCPEDGCGVGLVDAEAALTSLSLPPIQDTDGDGVADPFDNCLLVQNTDQRDTDGDNYGNICDADLNNDLIVNIVDLGLLRLEFFTDDPDADFDGDGTVNIVDLGIFRLLFGSPPGPSLIAVTPAVPELTIEAEDITNDGVAFDTDGIYTVSWTESAGADYYVLRTSFPPNDDFFNEDVYVETSVDIQVFIPAAYQYEVKACTNDDICSPFSDPKGVLYIDPNDGGNQ